MTYSMAQSGLVPPRSHAPRAVAGINLLDDALRSRVSVLFVIPAALLSRNPSFRNYSTFAEALDSGSKAPQE